MIRVIRYGYIRAVVVYTRIVYFCISYIHDTYKKTFWWNFSESFTLIKKLFQVSKILLISFKTFIKSLAFYVGFNLIIFNKI